MKTIFQTFVALVFCIVCYFSGKEFSGTKEKYISVFHSDTIRRVQYDTIWYAMPQHTVKVHDSIFVNVPQQIDTANILKQYFARFAYVDTLKDTSLLAVITDTVSRNKIQYRNFQYKILRPEKLQTIVNTTMVTPSHKHLLYGGLFFSGGSAIGAGPDLLLVDPSRAYGLQYDVLNKSLLLQITFKL